MTTTVTYQCTVNPVQVVYNGREITDGGGNPNMAANDAVAAAARAEYARRNLSTPTAITVTVSAT